LTEDSIAKTLPAPPYFGHVPGYGSEGIVRRPWRRAAHVPGRVHGWCCQCIEKDADETWDEAVAPYILCEPEWLIWRRLPMAAARRRWMRGRVAAKDAVRWLLLERFSLIAPLEALCILPDEHGQPGISCSTLPNRGVGICVSISHCGNTSVALATERSEFCRGLGIDVASQTDNHDGLAEGGFASAEMSLLDDCPLSERSDWLLRLWCAKEAAGKALGVGLRGNPLNVVVSQINRGRQSVAVEARAAPPPGELSAHPVLMTAHVGCDRGMAFAVAKREGI
jgi:phosphopantetheinyl transferase